MSCGKFVLEWYIGFPPSRRCFIRFWCVDPQVYTNRVDPPPRLQGAPLIFCSLPSFATSSLALWVLSPPLKWTALSVGDLSHAHRMYDTSQSLHLHDQAIEAGLDHVRHLHTDPVTQVRMQPLVAPRVHLLGVGQPRRRHTLHIKRHA